MEETYRNRFLLFVMFLLAVTSLFNHVAQNKALLQCEMKHKHLEERFQNVLFGIWQNQDEERKTFQEKESLRTGRVASFLSEVLASREMGRKSDFENLYNECTSSNRQANETWFGITEDLRQRLETAEALSKSTKVSLEQVIGEVASARNQSYLARRKAVEDASKFQSNEESLSRQIGKLQGEVARFKTELKTVRAGARSDSSFFSSLDAEPSLATPNIEPSSFSRLKQSTAPVRTLEVRKVMKDCNELALEFNKKRSGVTIATSLTTSANRCKRMCNVHELCQAWTFVTDTSECLLKQEIGKSVKADCCVSGVKCI